MSAAYSITLHVPQELIQAQERKAPRFKSVPKANTAQKEPRAPQTRALLATFALSTARQVSTAPPVQPCLCPALWALTAQEAKGAQTVSAMLGTLAN